MGLSVCRSVCQSLTLNAVTNRNRWTQRPEILHRGTYWSTVLRDQKLGHLDLLYWVLWHCRKCLYLHYLCKQLTCSYQICTVGAFCRGATTAWDLTYFSGSKGSQWTITFWDNQGGTNRNCTQRHVILCAQTN